MDRPTAVPLRIGMWRLDPATGQISQGEQSVRLEARTLRLLLCLAQRAGEVVSIEDLLTEVWSGVIVTQDSVYQAVASLRRVLGDDPKQPAYIATVPRLGYRMVASVALWTDEPVVPPEAAAARPAHASPSTPRFKRVGVLLAIAGALCIASALILTFHRNAKSVAVLPFLDLTTQEMNEEYFADGMTEELINKLSQVPGLKVPGPTSSFYFKNKHLKVSDIARSLGVTYVLDGSIRKSGDTLRVAARLVRADDGYVVWSDTYDRSPENKLKVQDEIAGQVAKALQASIH